MQMWVINPNTGERELIEGTPQELGVLDGLPKGPGFRVQKGPVVPNMRPPLADRYDDDPPPPPPRAA